MLQSEYSGRKPRHLTRFTRYRGGRPTPQPIARAGWSLGKWRLGTPRLRLTDSRSGIPMPKRGFLLTLLIVLSQTAAAADHPELTEADEAYSAERYEQAAALYRRDAELGKVAAQVNLAFLYLDGLGVKQDFGEAATWFRRAAEQGNAEAQQNLGLLLQDGRGVAQDYTEADKWFIIAGDKGNSAAAEQRMTPGQASEAHKRAEAWRADRSQQR
ncbi:MAG: sel1 repeat family protein [Methylococcaceae bacterium]|nr:sel1 repeat family protein [Methylococcaceae bacterium]